jgi:hypothetical protein
VNSIPKTNTYKEYSILKVVCLKFYESVIIVKHLVIALGFPVLVIYKAYFLIIGNLFGISFFTVDL